MVNVAFVTTGETFVNRSSKQYRQAIETMRLQEVKANLESGRSQILIELLETVLKPEEMVKGTFKESLGHPTYFRFDNVEFVCTSNYDPIPEDSGRYEYQVWLSLDYNNRQSKGNVPVWHRITCIEDVARICAGVSSYDPLNQKITNAYPTNHFEGENKIPLKGFVPNQASPVENTDTESYKVSIPNTYNGQEVGSNKPLL